MEKCVSQLEGPSLGSAKADLAATQNVLAKVDNGLPLPINYS